MKIGIITFHNALNAGAVLQAYALQTVLTQLGHHIEFIDYAPIKRYTLKDFIAKSPKNILHKWHNIYNRIKYSRHRRFNKVLQLGDKTYLSYDNLRNSPPNYDLYIAGSDQIWNFSTYISPIYTLDFVPFNKKKIAYAASMGQCNLDKSLYNIFKDKILKFDAISLREKNGVNFIQELVGNKKKIYQTLDPTLLINANQYNDIIDKCKMSNKPFISTYILSNIDEDDSAIISQIKKTLKLEVINLRNPDTGIKLKQAQNIIVTPYQWLNYIKNSNFVICSSFHAVVFSLIFHKPFIALVPPTNKTKGGNMRINSLLENIGLQNRIIYTFNQKQLETIINNNINWDEIDNKFLQLRQPSIDFLLKNIK